MDLVKDAIKKTTEKQVEPSQPEVPPVKPFKEMTRKEKAVAVRNIIINFPLFCYQWLRHKAQAILIKGKINYFVYLSKFRRWKHFKKVSIKQWLEGYKKISGDDFVKEFPPKKNHKACNGKGWVVVTMSNKQKAIRFCNCITDQYKASGKKYLIIEASK